MSRPLRFLQVTTFYPPYSLGGDGLYVERLAHALGDRGHQVDVVHCEDAYRVLTAGPPGAAAADHPNVRRHGLRSGVGRISSLVSQQTGRPGLKSRPLRRILETAKPDVIHYHNISLLGPGVLAMSPRRGPRPLKLYTTHEHWLICPTHVLWKFDERPCEGPDCLRCTLRERRPPQLWRRTGLLSRATAQVDRFLSPSKFSIRMHRERGFDRPLTHFPSFAEAADDDPPAGEPPPDERPYFLFVGRLATIKGVESLVSAWRRVAGADLLVVGTGSEDGRLKEMAADNPRVRFLGALAPAELGSLYARCLALIVPSVGFEVFPLVIPEAFARKAPVIARDLGGLTEMIEDTGGGLLFRDEEQLVSAVEQIQGSPELRAELGARGYAAVKERWSVDAHLDRYLQLLRELAEENLGGVPWDEDRGTSPPVTSSTE